MKNSFRDYMVERREILHKTQAMAAKDAGWSLRTFCRYETGGKLPRAPKKQEKLAVALGVTREELFHKSVEYGNFMENLPDKNILPLLRAIVGSTCNFITLDDVRFLKGIQNDLEKPISSALVDELIGHRHPTGD